MKSVSVIFAAALIMAIIYMSFGMGVQVGLGQGQTNTIVLPQLPAAPVPAEPPPVLPKGNIEHMDYTFSDKDEECMALNIYWEAKNQDLKGMLAVGLVTMQRVRSKHYPSDVCGVVWQQNRDRKTGNLVAQFSWTLDGKSDTPKNQKAWEQANRVASSFAGDGGTVKDFTDGAYLYHAYYVNPYWKKHYEQTATIGSHLFYK